MEEEKENILDFERYQTKIFDNSELVYKIEFDRILGQLKVTFTTEAVYLYHGVNQIAVDELCSAESPGKHFNAFFKMGPFKVEKLK